jgi:hypothetical protein
MLDYAGLKFHGFAADTNDVLKDLFFWRDKTMTTNENQLHDLLQIEELEAKTAPTVTIRPNTIVWDD